MSGNFTTEINNLDLISTNLQSLQVSHSFEGFFNHHALISVSHDFKHHKHMINLAIYRQKRYPLIAMIHFTHSSQNKNYHNKNNN